MALLWRNFEGSLKKGDVVTVGGSLGLGRMSSKLKGGRGVGRESAILENIGEHCQYIYNQLKFAIFLNFEMVW